MLAHKYDDTELETVDMEPLWYSRDVKKLRGFNTGIKSTRGRKFFLQTE